MLNFKYALIILMIVFIPSMLYSCSSIHLPQGKCHVFPYGDGTTESFCGPLDECFTGMNGIKQINKHQYDGTHWPFTVYNGSLLYGVPNGEGKVCIQTYKGGCSCMEWLFTNGEEEGNCIIISGMFQSRRVTGKLTRSNNPTEVINNQSLDDLLSKRFWNSGKSHLCKE